jgi:hypothetical protein
MRKRGTVDCRPSVGPDIASRKPLPKAIDVIGQMFLPAGACMDPLTRPPRSGGRSAGLRTTGPSQRLASSFRSLPKPDQWWAIDKDGNIVRMWSGQEPVEIKDQES